MLFDVVAPFVSDMFGKGALVAALAIAAAPQAEAFWHPSTAMMRGPGRSSAPALRSVEPALCRAVAPPMARARTSAFAPRMSAASDLCDVTIDMIKRVEKNIGELDDIKLARVSDG